MNAPLPVAVSIPSLALSEQELLAVLGSSIYPGAKVESMKLVISYCKARQLDPLQKPVHIVPMSVKVGKNSDGSDKYDYRDVIMPGVGLYRTDAARTGRYAGKSEPEFGPTKEFKFGESKMEYPEWCKVTVRRMVDGQVVDYTAKELWIENYATASRNTITPNAMWKKRPFGQLAKCTEAQALRMAFPEAVSHQSTAEEMEGKSLDGDVIDAEPVRQVEGPKSKTESAAPAAAPTSTPSEGVPSAGNGGAAPDTKDSQLLSDGAKTTLKKALERAGRTETDLIAAGFGKIDEMRFAKFNDVMQHIKANPAAAAA